MSLEALCDEFCACFDVSRESFGNLEIYHALLLKWQKTINLVSPKTLPEVWDRHFVDSAQIVKHIPAGVTRVVDLGSGGGFPSLVLAILRPDLEVHAIESDERKAQFLRRVSRETSAGLQVHNARVEAVIGDLAPDLVTARAFASLSDILGYCAPLFHVNHCDVPLLLMKGRGVVEEITAAQENYDFDAQTFPSITDPEASLLYIKAVQKRP